MTSGISYAQSLYDVIVIGSPHALDWDVTQYKDKSVVFYASNIITPEMAKQNIETEFVLHNRSWSGNRARLPQLDNSYTTNELEILYDKGINPVKTTFNGSYVWGNLIIDKGTKKNITSFLLYHALDSQLLSLMTSNEMMHFINKSGYNEDIIWYYYTAKRINLLNILACENRIELEPSGLLYREVQNLQWRLLPDILRLSNEKDEEKIVLKFDRHECVRNIKLLLELSN